MPDEQKHKFFVVYGQSLCEPDLEKSYREAMDAYLKRHGIEETQDELAETTKN